MFCLTVAALTTAAVAQSTPPATPKVSLPATTGPAATSSASATTKPAATKPSVQASAFATHGFFAEMTASIIGKGPDDPARLPTEQRDLWDAAMRADAQGKKAEALESLRALDDSIKGVPVAQQRLEAVSKRERPDGEGYSAWIARLHWEILEPTYKKNGIFDLKDVRDSEKAGIIGILREKTSPSLEPLKSYFPDPDAKTGLMPLPVKLDKLMGITVDNAIDVKDKALYANAVLQAQMKLEPTMPAADRRILVNQVAVVQQILGRARTLEPQARALAAKAEAEKKAATQRQGRGMTPTH
jgi:hypothetical protein